MSFPTESVESSYLNYTNTLKPIRYHRKKGYKPSHKSTQSKVKSTGHFYFAQIWTSKPWVNIHTQINLPADIDDSNDSQDR